jgi:hypothetical protein
VNTVSQKSVSFSHTDWTEQKASLAERLAKGECGGSYAEAVLISCAAISAVAAFTWPGDKIDRARFVELLVREVPLARRISIPLLIAHLAQRSRHVYARKLYRKFLPDTGSAVVTGEDVDREAAEVRAVCPRLRVSEVRTFSYANLLYQRLRSPMAHEYRTGTHTVPYSMTDRDDVAVSYYNWAREPGAKSRPLSRQGLPIRHIYFHIPWLAGLVRDLGKWADATSRRPAQPSEWWIHR